jgi:diguanylate cyclase (GGDEF)-like protein
MESMADQGVQEYGERLDFLQTSGALDHLEELRKESRELDSLINDAAGLFALSEVEEMIDYATRRILDRFIPTHLVFLIELPDGGGIKAYPFCNMKPDENDFPVRFFKYFRDYFHGSPYTAGFAEIWERLGPDCFGPELLAYEPELAIPMHGIGGLFGMVLLGKKLVGGEYTSLERMYADRLIRFLSICIQNRLHRERSITDAKTGLYNCAYLTRRLDEEASRVGRGKSSSGLLMLDIDNFKRFNDTWGHLAGDEVLLQIAGLLKRSVRSEDVAARFGGEEFCVLLVDCNEGKLFEVAERIRKSISANRVPYKGEQLSVTASIGCCQLDPSWRGDGASYIERADKALYLSKTRGRNRTTLYRFGLLGRATTCVGG